MFGKLSRPSRPIFSLTGRTLLTSALVLVILFSSLGVFLEQGFVTYNSRLEQARLHNFALTFISQLLTEHEDPPQLPERWHDHHYFKNEVYFRATLVNLHGWSFASPNSQDFAWPLDPDPNDFRLVPVHGDSFYTLHQEISWQTTSGNTYLVRFDVAESARSLTTEIFFFRLKLAGGFALSGLLLLLLQWTLLKWSLSPLSSLKQNIDDLFFGEIEHLDTARLPVEIRPFGSYIEQLVVHSREQLRKYRVFNSDVAHSLRTPLAVLTLQIETSLSPAEARPLLTQTQRLYELIDSQLKRNRFYQSATLHKSLPVLPVATKLIDGLNKLYASRPVVCTLTCPATVKFRISEGDLLDLLGNLVDNACKYGHSRVLLSITTLLDGSLAITVEDDGPGVPPDKVDLIKSRGGRLDEHAPGYGLGLSSVQAILQGFHGQLDITRSPTLGGACFTAILHRPSLPLSTTHVRPPPPSSSQG